MFATSPSGMRHLSSFTATAGDQTRLTDLEFGSLLGEGAFARVLHAQDRRNGREYAVKVVEKRQVQAHGRKSSVLAEKAMLSSLDHPGVVRLYFAFQDDWSLYFVLELVSGGELATQVARMAAVGAFPLDFAKYYAAEIVAILAYLRVRRVAHRDLKPENLLLDSKGYCKITDFGLAKFVIGHSYTTCGTPDYFAPEMVLGLGHTNAVDWWTLGVLVYELMMSDTPFSAQDTIHIFRKVTRGMEFVNFPPRGDWPSLVKGLCKQDPSERLPMRKDGSKTVEEHPWFKNGGFDWKALDARTMAAPYVPQVKSANDLANFEAHQEDAPPEIPYSDPGNGWDNGFEEVRGPAKFE
mmetsp:Transcript_24799/g.67719  ORF Transcript_24799/g.67719 Transcript_24799/m.67719 type:complete len:352 (-) Transcript_24799:219-1274(-)